MGSTLTYSGQLVVTSCWCGIAVAIPSDLHHHAKQDATFSVFCPLGHKFCYRTTEATDLRRELEAERRRTATQVARLDQEKASHASTKGRLTATKGVLTKTRKRVANGVCPCCHRSFVQLGRHMTTQHPDYAQQSKA